MYNLERRIIALESGGGYNFENSYVLIQPNFAVITDECVKSSKDVVPLVSV